MESLGQQHDWTEMVCIDSLRLSLKAVLLHNGNKYPPVPTAFYMKKSYNTMQYCVKQRYPVWWIFLAYL
jgi:hypothetical protein